MRDLHWEESDAVIQSNLLQQNFFPKITKTIFITQKFQGKIICSIKRQIKYIKKGGVDNG